MPAARLSAAIVTYRPDPRIFERALASLAAAVALARRQGLVGQVSLFVVDNGPRAGLDSIREALGAWPADAGTLELIAGHGNLGYGRANNLVRDRLDSDFHLVMNPDVELAPEALAAVLAAFEAHADVGIVAPAVFGESGARLYLCKRYPSLWVLWLRGFAPAFVRRRQAKALAEYEMRDVIGERYVAPVPLASGCFMAMRTALFRRLGGFDPRFFMYFEDYDLSLRAGRESLVAYVPEARIVHHGGEAARKGWRHVTWFIASAVRFFNAHGWRLR